MLKLLCSAFLLFSWFAQAQSISTPQAGTAGGALKFTSAMTVQSLAGRPDAELVELSNGKSISVGALRRLDAARQKMLAAKVASTPSVLRIKPAATGIRVNNRADFLTALNSRQDSETIQLPSGRRVTIGQIRLVQPYIEKRMGRKLSDLSQQQQLSGPAIKITAASTDKTFWKDMLQQPGNDNKVLESPHGKRITVGELKQYLAKSAKTRRGMIPTQGLPVTAPTQGGLKGRAQ